MGSCLEAIIVMRVLLALILGAAVGIVSVVLLKEPSYIVIEDSPNFREDYAVSLIDGEEVITLVPDEFGMAGSWTPGDTKPGVDANEAYLLASKALRNFFSSKEDAFPKNSEKFSTWIVSEMTLVPVESGKWYWRVTFETQIPDRTFGNVGPAARLAFVISMERQVIAPNYD